MNKAKQLTGFNLLKNFRIPQERERKLSEYIDIKKVDYTHISSPERKRLHF